ncbi:MULTISPECIES: hypothetical protein [Leclercia]|uniref:Uncharacterized protein n=1 Tax=Leclercia adecarboxylata TaxID=83655 RepID=A0A5B8KF23_9ENTR|nr:hypothetical protein [Leclercia adecarboxylata]QDY98175.1 Hypothetical protein [Leclercia adecarboxylata]
MQLFHGTRQRFDRFDVSVRGTGEAGSINACWFTDNFKGACNHALLKNRNPGNPLVYRCTLKKGCVIANHRQLLSEQPDIASRLRTGLPVSISSQLGRGLDWHALNEPRYTYRKGSLIYEGNRHVEPAELISLYMSCGIQGVYDWEGIFTDSYLHGTTTVIFDTDVLDIREVIEVLQF